MNEVKQVKRCECCLRTPEEIDNEWKDSKLIENEVWLCGDCAIMYQALWRVECSPIEPDVERFLSAVKGGWWKPKENEQYEELANLARRPTCLRCGSPKSTPGGYSGLGEPVYIKSPHCADCGEILEHG